MFINAVCHLARYNYMHGLCLFSMHHLRLYVLYVVCLYVFCCFYVFYIYLFCFFVYTAHASYTVYTTACRRHMEAGN